MSEQAETTTRTEFVIQERWNDSQRWQDARYARRSSNVERARENRDRYLADFAAGKVYEADKYGEAVPVPQVRIQQRVSTWSVVE